jgi:hypothetical protein
VEVEVRLRLSIVSPHAVIEEASQVEERIQVNAGLQRYACETPGSVDIHAGISML